MWTCKLQSYFKALEIQNDMKTDCRDFIFILVGFVLVGMGIVFQCMYINMILLTCVQVGSW